MGSPAQPVTRITSPENLEHSQHHAVTRSTSDKQTPSRTPT